MNHSASIKGLAKVFLCSVLLALLAHHPALTDDLTPKQVKFFETKIRPVLVQHCYKCHSTKAGKTKGALALDTRQAIRAGGDSGHAVVPGDLEASLIISALKHESFEMPPNKQLSENVIRDFENWIKMGAPDPREGKSVVKNKSSIDFAEGRKFWAFQKPRKLDPPQVKNQQWPSSELDRFVLHKLEEAGLQPAAQATESQLIRRDFINLIGVPPTQKQLEDYLADDTPDKREKLIDQLLDSPQFGERWGRHWLDVARFAESNGRERNFLYPHAWRFRNYVIDSFNADKPFDRFIREQLAGDLIEPLPGQDPQELKVATGLLAIGPKQLNERNKEIFSMDMVDEQMDVVCRSTMAITVTCARCHDHKFDPISTKDYYAVAGIFRSTETLFGKGGNGSRHSSALVNLDSDKESSNKAQSEHQAKIDDLSQKIKVLNAQIKKASSKGNRKKNAKSRKGQAKKSAGQTTSAKEVAAMRKRLKALQANLKRLRQTGPVATNVAMGVREGQQVDCNVLIRGEVTAKGDKVPRGFLTVLGADQRRVVKQTEQSGRLELAEWIVAPENPLTARVTVNRIWLHLFGEGLVRTVDNFGESGERPTHPELLDFLAHRLVEHKWSFKKMIREIMLTRTYRLSSGFIQENYDVDPDNRLIWRMNSRRMDAEAMRDSILLAAGSLDLARPKSSVVARYKSSQGIGRGVTEETFDVETPHRSVYLPVVRNAVPEPLRVFDFAEPSILVGDRQVTTVPTQALFMMNSSFVIEQSKKLASRVAQPGASEEKQIESAYKLVLARGPSNREIQRAVDFLRTSREKLANQNKKPSDANLLALTAFCQALFASGEFRMLN